MTEEHLLGFPCWSNKHKDCNNKCKLCEKFFCGGCYNKRNELCHRCCALLRNIRKHGSRSEPGINWERVENILGYASWLKRPKNRKEGVNKNLKEIASELIKRQAGAKKPSTQIGTGTYWGEYSKFDPEDIIPVLGCERQNFSTHFDIGVNFEEHWVLFEEITTESRKFFEGWAILKSPDEELFYFIDVDLYSPCSSCDGQNDLKYKIRYSDNLEALLKFCLDDQKFTVLKEKLFENN